MFYVIVLIICFAIYIVNSFHKNFFGMVKFFKLAILIMPYFYYTLSQAS